MEIEWHDILLVAGYFAIGLVVVSLAACVWDHEGDPRDFGHREDLAMLILFWPLFVAVSLIVLAGRLLTVLPVWLTLRRQRRGARAQLAVRKDYGAEAEAEVERFLGREAGGTGERS